MSDTHWFEGGWQRNNLGGFDYYPPGNYSDGANPPPEYAISDRAIRALVPVLEQHGFIPKPTDPAVRVEDLKITHRLLDLLDKQAEGFG